MFCYIFLPSAILSLLHPRDRYRTPSAIGSAIGRPLSRPISHPNTGRSPQPPRSKPLGGAQPRDSGAIVSKPPLKQARNKNAIEAAILNRVLDRDWALNRRGPLRRCEKVSSPAMRQPPFDLSEFTGEMPEKLRCEILACWVLFRPTFLSAQNSWVFVLCDLVKLTKIDWDLLKLTENGPDDFAQKVGRNNT